MKIALDFDGVLHSDTQGIGSGNVIPDPPVPGAMEKLHELLHCDVVTHIVIFSLRCGGEHGIKAMCEWIAREYIAKYPTKEFPHIPFSKISFSSVKPHVDLFIDDRNLAFNGNWSDPQFSLENLLNFKPWNR